MTAGTSALRAIGGGFTGLAQFGPRDGWRAAGADASACGRFRYGGAPPAAGADAASGRCGRECIRTIPMRRRTAGGRRGCGEGRAGRDRLPVRGMRRRAVGMRRASGSPDAPRRSRGGEPGACREPVGFRPGPERGGRPASRGPASSSSPPRARPGEGDWHGPLPGRRVGRDADGDDGGAHRRTRFEAVSGPRSLARVSFRHGRLSGRSGLPCGAGAATGRRSGARTMKAKAAAGGSGCRPFARNRPKHEKKHRNAPILGKIIVAQSAYFPHSQPPIHLAHGEPCATGSANALGCR